MSAIISFVSSPTGTPSGRVHADGPHWARPFCLDLSVMYVPEYIPEWESSRLGMAPWRRMASAV